MTHSALGEWQGVFIATLMDPDRLPAAVGVTPALVASASARFDVYRNNVFYSLANALAELFPVTEQLLGEAFFRGLATAHVRTVLPSRPDLQHYGEDFPEFVTTHEACADLPWLADVCRLELARRRAYHAYDSQPLDAPALAAYAIEDLLASRIELLPSVCLHQSQWAVRSVWEAHQQDSVDLDGVQLNCPQYTVVFRPAWDVVVIGIDEALHAFLFALQAQHSLGEALEQSAVEFPSYDSAAALAFCISQGFIADVEKSRQE